MDPDEAADSERSLAARTQALRERASRTLAASRDFLRSEDARWRALIVVGRFTAHSAIVFVLLLAVILASLGLGAATNSGRPSSLAATPAGTSQPAARSPVILSAGGGGRLFSPGGNFQQAGASEQDVSVIVRNVVLDTERPVEVRTSIITYTVRPGDNVETIAQRFGLLPTTIVWSNKDIEDNPDILRVGQVLNVLPLDGIWYTVQADDTLSSIAEKFKANVDDIVTSPLNNLSAGSNLLPGTRVVVPGGVKPFVPRVVEAQTGRAPATGRGYTGPAPGFATSGSFGWPTRGFISQGYWWGHRGLDIANGIGVPVAASDGGYVTYAGWSPVGYGYMVQIDHGNGFSTLYAHLSQWYVDPGQAVARGQIIGAMGSTGNSTGPHLHFELRYGGAPQNPLVYLP
jgi:murein DD-endopeptidase MepM/ murein hydrolase activator NlpD